MESKARVLIEQTLDPGSFCELGAGAIANSNDSNIALSDGVITGYGTVEGQTVYVYSQDADVLSGSVGTVHAGKIKRLYEMAVKTGAPVIGFLDSAGMRLNEGSSVLDGFGKILAEISKASGTVLQIAVVSGNCAGGFPMIPALCDFCFIIKDEGRLFVNSPNALINNDSSKLDNTREEFILENGLADMAGTEEEVISAVKKLLSILPANYRDVSDYGGGDDDPNRLCTGIEACRSDPLDYLKMIADDGYVFETLSGYARDIVTGFMRINEMTVGFTAQYGRDLSPDGAKKTAALIDYCDAFSIPFITFVNVKGYERTVDAEKDMARAAASLVQTYAAASIPKITVVTGDSFGTAFTCMGSRSIGADICFAWNDVKIGAIAGELAARIISDGKQAEEVKNAALHYDMSKNSVGAAAANGIIDAVIAPEETRKYLAGALDLLSTKE